MRNLDIQIERWPVDRLIPSDVNPRTHSAEQVAQIAASIREFGFVKTQFSLVPTAGSLLVKGAFGRPARRAPSVPSSCAGCRTGTHGPSTPARLVASFQG